MAPKKKTQSPLENQRRCSPRLASLSAAEPPKKKLKTTPNSPKPDQPHASKKTIIVEHCKQCKSFKNRALQVKKGLEECVDGLQVVLNPENPRKGCFEIREQDGESFVTLLDMKRPFTPMKELVMEDVITDIVAKIK